MSATFVQWATAIFEDGSSILVSKQYLLHPSASTQFQVPGAGEVLCYGEEKNPASPYEVYLQDQAESNFP